MTQTPLTITLSANEQAVLQTLAQERSLSDPVAAFHVLLQDAASVYDALWDQSFAKSQDVLERLANEARDEYIRGETEELDLDADERLI